MTEEIDVVEETFKEMDKVHEKPVTGPAVIEDKVKINTLTEMNRKELIKVLRENSAIKKQLSANINSLVEQRKKVTEENIKIREELKRRE